MFVIIRKIHLYTSFAIAVFLLMYFISGSTMLMENIFPRNNPHIFSVNQFIVPGKSESILVDELCKAYKITGHERKIVQNDKIVYTYRRPAYLAEIEFKGNNDSVSVKITKGQFGRLMSDFHRLRGFDSFIHIVWGIFYDLSCLGLIIFAFTGMYMWLKMERKRMTGSIFLLASTIMTFFMVWYLMSIC